MNKTRIALATAFAAINVLPLQANAETGVFKPARCGPNSTYGIASYNGDIANTIFRKGTIEATALPANTSNVERRVGYELNIEGLKPVRVAGGGFEEAKIYFSVPSTAGSQTNPLTPEDLVAHFYFEDSLRKVRTFKELGITQFEKGTWQQAVATSGSIGGANDLLIRIVVYMRNSKNRHLLVNFGNVEVKHKNQGGLNGGFVNLNGGGCRDLE